MSQLDRSFGRLRDLPCWGVKRGFGSFLTFEFGEPRLVIREPIGAGLAMSSAGRRVIRRRTAYARGEWHLWIYCCHWGVFEGERLVGDCSSNRRIDRAAGFLNGQKVESLTISPKGMRCAFQFDLGGRLETRPFDRKSEQWMLYEPSGRVLAVRADRTMSYVGAKRRADEQTWHRID